ncbi:thiamine pyrophosphate enzyme domain protein TPP-binding [Rhizorhabdus wittichii RW1]|uniref:Thiamine pyrophosphate enzyme domain protein TPP-binding n=1 Tax=Rhizorhabdus wittichii (strain DSM 6014 / CCUG 31198 / JCM 15750 / NBRC 105917 / EY 4224 / RW1) TaxID=392499 RepID=A0A9J9HAQ4_RHIWR|nr:thiamine pyrophosphate enzyme domain protein TPP-binding [Rhizorhabdus wittichii RW1]
MSEPAKSLANLTGAADRQAEGLSRRTILNGVAAGTTVACLAPSISAAGPVREAHKPVSVPLPPSRESECGPSRPAPPKRGNQQRYGSDYMIDVMRNLGIRVIAANPGTTFKGLHESLVNHGMTTEPAMDLVTVTHEEISVAFAHGYAKAAGEPMGVFLHSAVGLQHAAMAIYNAWCDRVPVFCVVGAKLDSARRGYPVEWLHSVNDGAALVRDFTKWDDQPASLVNFAESAARALRFAQTPPHGPVLLAVPATLQEDPAEPQAMPPLPTLSLPRSPAGDPEGVERMATMLAQAGSPVLIADRLARSPKGMERLVRLAELLQASVVDLGGRMNFPWRHPLNQTANQDVALGEADVVLGLELTDFWAISTHQLAASAKRLSITSLDLFMKANYQDFQRYTPVDLALAADAEDTLPALIEAVERQLDPKQADRRRQRGERLAEAHREALDRAREAAAIGWDNEPITTGRLCAELYDQIRAEDWCLLSSAIFQQFWPQQLWDARHHYQYIGDSGAYGLGYLPGASVGAAYAHARHGRLAVAIGGDGDLMYAPGALWTAAHHRIPLLYVVHNNGGYHQETMVIQWLAALRERGLNRGQVGNVLLDPLIDFALLARSLGVHAEGPVKKPGDLKEAIARALAVVRKGLPALIDVHAEAR